MQNIHNQCSTAQECLSKSLAASRLGTPSSPADVYMEQGNKHLEHGQYRLAAKAFSKAIELEPNNPECYLARAYAYKHDEALPSIWITDLERAISLFNVNPGYPQSQLALAHYMLGAAIYDEFAAMPSDGSPRIETLRKIKAEAAIANLNRAIHFDSTHSFIFEQRGTAYRETGMLWEAISDYSQAITLTSKPAILIYGRGRLYAAVKQWKLALVDFQKAVVLDPKFTAAILAAETASSELEDLNHSE